MSKEFTVVLQRPKYISEEEGTDVYVAFVEAEHIYDAVKVAQIEVFTSDKIDGLRPKEKEDYLLAVLFAGHQNPLLWGWQL